ncbi:MAG TPA: sugar ABC transporter ATP-binding protein [Blastocatellia bacterium]|nr:sugar ABC transporter ATP-binding protein [Blastocatellia bacterium]
MPLLELRDIAKRFGPTVALDGVSLSLDQGEVLALIGENGAGKSTLMNILSGALRKDAGEMMLDGQTYAPASPVEARARGIALIHQELSLCPHLSVAENILLGAERARFGWFDWQGARRQALEVLESFHHPEIRPDRLAAELSPPARQVVEICRAMAARARIILMDEPTSSLQREDVERLFTLINRLKASGTAIIYISHFLEEVRLVADRFTVLRDGRSVAAGEMAGVTNDALIAQMVGRTIEQLFAERHHHKAGEVILEARDLSAPPGLKSASFELRRGEIFGIAGLMGSGRSELVRALYGLDALGSGTLAIKQQPVALRSAATARLRRGLGYLSEDRKGEGLALALSVADNTTMTRMRACARRWGWLDLSRQKQQVAGLIAQLKIKARAPQQPARTLSGGNQQKVAVARLLHQDAEVLLLDEPTRGIDIGSKAQIYENIARLADAGKAILMVSSYLPELFGLADRLAVMSRGRLSAARPIDEWTPESVMKIAIGEAGDS